MIHYVIVKFKDPQDRFALKDEIEALFATALEIEGVEKVEVRPSCSERENRYHLMIAMTMTEEGLERYDVSEMHKRWKADYGDRIALKTIFDHE